MQEKLFVVLNPAAGQRSGDVVRQALAEHFSAEEWDIDIYETTGNENLPDIVRQAVENGASRVLAAGGDGTISEVADALVSSKIPVGIIPVGTANVLAQELELPLTVDEACAMLAGPTTIRAIDVMKIGKKVCLLHVGIGITTDLMKGTTREAKNRWGAAAYIATFFREIFGYRPKPIKLVVDGHARSLRASEVMIANGGEIGVLNLTWGKHIQVDDGVIDICVIHLKDFQDYLGSLWSIIANKERRDSRIEYLSAIDSIELHAEGNHPLPIQGDGDIIGKTPLKAKILPKALSILVPAIAIEEQPESDGTSE